MNKIFIVISFIIGCSSSTDNNIDNIKCIDDCCYSNNFNCDEFSIDGKNPVPYSVECKTAHYGLKSSGGIGGKVCYNKDNEFINFCCQKP